MSPDERARTPMPDCCQTCESQVKIVRSTGAEFVTRQECNHPAGVLPHPRCPWYKARVIPLGNERNTT